jgi:hypothetical protein
MKNFIILSFFMLFVIAVTAQDQSTNQTQSDTTIYVYCQIVGTGRLMSNKVTIEIDFGQFRSIWTDNRLKDPVTGNRIIFNGMIDALNYMGNLGWEFVQAYAFSQGNNPPVFHYLLKKSKKILDEEDTEVQK